MFVWIQEWTETERGWGKRPDGYTIHLKEAHIQEFLNEMRKREAQSYKGTTPDEYSYPEGNPYVADIKDRKLLADLKASANGIWGPGREAPKPVRPPGDPEPTR
jgi:hypothetical protein